MYGEAFRGLQAPYSPSSWHPGVCSPSPKAIESPGQLFISLCREAVLDACCPVREPTCSPRESCRLPAPCGSPMLGPDARLPVQEWVRVQGEFCELQAHANDLRATIEERDDQLLALNQELLDVTLRLKVGTTP